MNSTATISVRQINRIIRHNNGYVRSTKPYRPWKLVFQMHNEDRSSAIRYENKLKSYKSRSKIEELIASDLNEMKK